MKELGIYIHIPFCKKKCYYCDFISFENKTEFIERYIVALNKEITSFSNSIKKYEVTTIYIGGGTPSVIDEKYIEDIINSLIKNYNISKKVEITIEVNPGTVNEQKIKKYKEIGINRLSIGLQSTDDDLLKKIGRIHNYEDFLTTYNLARKIGFNNINVDLMLGLPSQTLEVLQESLENVIKLKPEHISVYSLIVEGDTKIEKMLSENKIQLPEEDIERKMYWMVKEKLEEASYIHYEISNFAKKGYKSKHNWNCWKQKEYLGFGVSAHSYINNKRFCNMSLIEEYIRNIEDGKIDNNKKMLEEQTIEDKKKEYMLLALRKIEGVKIQEFKNLFIDDPIFLYRKELEKLVKEELIEIDGDYIKLTSKGLDFANLVWEEFV